MRSKVTTCFIVLFACRIACGNVNHIDFTKIANHEKYDSLFFFLMENQQYCNHWTPKWDYDVSKDSLLKRLIYAYKVFSSIPNKNEELYILLGDVASYLYNLNEEDYFDSAVVSYNAAIKADSIDYRGYWFLGYHHVLSTVTDKGIEELFKAESRLPSDQPSDFWENYAHATALANMPSHSIFAMDRVRNISGREGNFETQLEKSVRNRIININPDSSHSWKDIWYGLPSNEEVAFVCRPLGIELLIDTAWGVNFYNYEKHTSAIIITPSSLKNGKGREIKYTIAMVVKVASESDKLDNFVANFTSKHPNKNKIIFSDKYSQMIAYEIKDPDEYEDIGGAHLYMIGVEREMPEYPGLLLESAITLPSGDKGKVNYYRAGNSYNRFKGKIFYLIMLDTCEDIFEQSSSIFKTLFDDQMIIE